MLAETAHQQVTNEPVVAPLQSLEKSRANKRILTHELPAFTSKKALDSNIWHFLTGAGLDEDGISALHNHLVGSSSATVRAEFLRKQDAQKFLTHMPCAQFQEVSEGPGPERHVPSGRRGCAHYFDATVFGSAGYSGRARG